mgnify:FL=1
MAVIDMLRHDWKIEEAKELFELPMNDLLFKSHTVFRENFDPNKIQVSTLLNIKEGGCTENCGYCSQNVHNNKDVRKTELIEIQQVKESAQRAKKAGLTRLCMGAAWRNPKDKDMPHIKEIIKTVKGMGLEACMTLGMVTQEQANELKEVGLDYFNHNLDTSREHYPNVVTTRTYDDRLRTLDYVRNAGLNVCCGGIVGLGENLDDRASMLCTLANLPEHPHSVPINMLVKLDGTQMLDCKEVDHLDFVRMIAVARIMLPESHVRLSAGRGEMSESTQAMCFFAGANSIFYGDKLLTTDNVSQEDDMALFGKLGLQIEK